MTPQPPSLDSLLRDTRNLGYREGRAAVLAELLETLTADSLRADAEAPERLDVERLARRLELAEQVCLMVGWTASDNSDRGKAKHELWATWLREYEAQGGSHEVKAHPELSDARIRELAAQRDATVHRVMARLTPASEEAGK